MQNSTARDKKPEKKLLVENHSTRFKEKIPKKQEEIALKKI